MHPFPASFPFFSLFSVFNVKSAVSAHLFHISAFLFWLLSLSVCDTVLSSVCSLFLPLFIFYSSWLFHSLHTFFPSYPSSIIHVFLPPFFSYLCLTSTYFFILLLNTFSFMLTLLSLLLSFPRFFFYPILSPPCPLHPFVLPPAPCVLYLGRGASIGLLLRHLGGKWLGSQPASTGGEPLQCASEELQVDPDQPSTLWLSPFSLLRSVFVFVFTFPGWVGAGVWVWVCWKALLPLTAWLVPKKQNNKKKTTTACFYR